MEARTARRARSDSTTAAIKAFEDTTRRVEWPEAEVTRPAQSERAQKIFDRIISARAADDWREADPILIAQLATATLHIDEQQVEIEKEGFLVETLGRNGKVHMVRNPRLDVLISLQSRQLSLTRALGLAGLPVGKATVANAARKASEVRTRLESTLVDSLIAQ